MFRLYKDVIRRAAPELCNSASDLLISENLHCRYNRPNDCCPVLDIATIICGATCCVSGYPFLSPMAVSSVAVVTTVETDSYSLVRDTRLMNTTASLLPVRPSSRTSLGRCSLKISQPIELLILGVPQFFYEVLGIHISR